MLWEPTVKIKQHILVQLLSLKDVVVCWQGIYLLPPFPSWVEVILEKSQDAALHCTGGLQHCKGWSLLLLLPSSFGLMQ